MTTAPPNPPPNPFSDFAASAVRQLVDSAVSGALWDMLPRPAQEKPVETPPATSSPADDTPGVEENSGDVTAVLGRLAAAVERIADALETRS